MKNSIGTWALYLAGGLTLAGCHGPRRTESPYPAQHGQRVVYPFTTIALDKAALAKVQSEAAGAECSIAFCEFSPTPETVQLAVQEIAIEPAAVPTIRDTSHSDDDRALTGKVYSWRQTWKLRYADYSATDPYGGSVMLEGGQLDDLRDGCQVRVEGKLIPPAERTSPARFQVRSLQIISQ